MANKFTKLNIGDTVSSGSGRVFRKLSTVQLPPPYGLTIDGDYLTWGDYSTLATSFDILVDGVVKGTVSAPTNSFDLLTLGLADGTYSITVVSKASGYANSNPSEAVSYTVGGEDELAGTWVFTSDLGVADSFDMDVGDTITDLMFTSKNRDWMGIGASNGTLYYLDHALMETNVFTNDGTSYAAWVNDAYKTITITSKLSEVTNGSTLLAWLKANATKQ